MIGYLQGTLLNMEQDRILLLVGGVGYELLLPAFAIESLRGKEAGDPLSFHVYYQQTERQPKPVLIGFDQALQKEFFQLFISVEGIGPLKAVKAMTLPVEEIARAIEAKDVAKLKTLKGIGQRAAQKIVATLEGKMGQFAGVPADGPVAPAVQGAPSQEWMKQVETVMVSQLGHRLSDARRMIAEALERDPAIDSAENLFDEIYRGENRQ